MNEHRMQQTDISTGRKPYHIPPNLLEQGHPASPPLAGCPVEAKEKVMKERRYITNITRTDHLKKKICRAMSQLSNALDDQGLDEAELGAKVLDTAARLAALAFIMCAGMEKNVPAREDALNEMRQRIDAFSHRSISACGQNATIYPPGVYRNYYPVNIQGYSPVYRG